MTTLFKQSTFKRVMLVLFLILTPTIGHSKLSDFREDVEKTEKENSQRQKEEDSKKEKDDQKEKDKDTSDPCSQACGAMAGQICGSLLEAMCQAALGPLFSAWGGHLGSTNYGAFPYSDHGFIRIPEVVKTGNPENPIEYETTGVRDQWFSVEAHGLLMEGMGYGGWVALKGALFRPIGPYFDFFTFYDGVDTLIGVRPGLALALFQTDPMSLYLFGQVNIWSGSLSRAGGIAGLEIRSYPVAPIALRFKGDFQFFGTFTMVEGEAELGVMIGPGQILAGWRSWKILESYSSSVYHGPFGGLKFHF